MQYNEKEERAIAKFGVTHVVHDVLGIDEEVKDFMKHRFVVSSEQVWCHIDCALHASVFVAIPKAPCTVRSQVLSLNVLVSCLCRQSTIS